MNYQHKIYCITFIIFAILITAWVLIMYEPYKYHIKSKSYTKIPLGFATTEHRVMGEEVILKNEIGTKIPGGKYIFNINENLINFGHLIAYPDYFGDPNIIISSGKTEQDRMAYFTQTLNFALNTNKNEVKEIINLMNWESDELQILFNKYKSWEKAYSLISEQIDIKANQITGGGSLTTPYYPLGRYLKIAANNLDHFAPQAISAFRAGWSVGILHAMNQNLNRAYIAIGFACHFLTDGFASGHIRTPRKALHDKCYPSMVGGLLSKECHDFDNVNGVKVKNNRGDEWTTYGDCVYFENKNFKNRSIVNEVLQQAVDDIWFAYANKKVPEYKYDNIVPLYSELYNNPNAFGNVTPIFAVKNNKLYHRDPWNEISSKTSMKEWFFCMPTYIELKLKLYEHKLMSNLSLSTELLLTPLEIAMLTDKDLISFQKILKIINKFL